MKNVNEAIDFAILKVLDLKEKGVKVSLKKYPDKLKAVYEGFDPKKDAEMDKWVNIALIYNSESQLKAINDLSSYLGMCGISFDCGGMGNERDWEFDWSFNFSPGQENWEFIEANKNLEEMLKDFPSEQD